MQDTDWDDLRYFLAVGQTGSLSGAAKALTVNHSTVLRRLASLEKRLGVRLFERRTGGYVMTASGEELHARLQPVAATIESAQRRLGGRDLRLSGTIRTTSTDTLVLGLLTPYFAEFCALHPGIQLQVVISNMFFSLTKREADVAIRPTPHPPENLVGRRIGRIQTALYGSRRYLEQHPPGRPWADYDWVAVDESLAHLAQAKWLREHVPEDRFVYRVDSLVGMAAAVRAGCGLGLLLCLNADNDPELVQIDRPIEALDTPLWLLTHPDLRQVARIKAFTDFLAARLSASHLVIPDPRPRVGRGT